MHILENPAMFNTFFNSETVEAAATQHDYKDKSLFEAKKQSNPPPLPRSKTVSPLLSEADKCGLPHPSPIFDASGTDLLSDFLYPCNCGFSMLF